MGGDGQVLERLGTLPLLPEIRDADVNVRFTKERAMMQYKLFHYTEQVTS